MNKINDLSNRKSRKRLIVIVCFASVILILLLMVGCDIYSCLYEEFTIELINNSKLEITEIKISKVDEIIKDDTETIEIGSSREYTVDERGVYTLEWTLSNALVFSEDIDFSSLEKKIIKVVE